tara:strand:- start:1543 stop:1971 length:429 start_codon:yes stop_codon:yes gene_type:complete
MAEKERVALNDTIDYTKMLTELSIGSSYIFALEQLMMYHIIRLDNPGETPLIFAKFEKYVTGEIDLEKDPWTEIEMHLFTIFSLQQMLKARAHQMGFTTKNAATLDPDLVDELTTATLSNNVEKVAELNEKIEKSIKEQQLS